MVTTIQIEESLRDKLEKLKVHHRESYNDLILRLASSFSSIESDKEGLMETVSVLADSEMMRGIAKGLEDFEKGRFKSLKQIKKEIYRE